MGERMNNYLPNGPAARLALIQEMLAPPIYGYDVDGNEYVIGYGEPLITKDQAFELLNAVTPDEPNYSC